MKTDQGRNKQISFRTFLSLFLYFPPFFPPFFAKLKIYFFKKSKVKFFLLARAIHNKHFLLQCLNKEISTARELDLRPLGKVIIFRDKQTNRQNLPIIYR